MKNKIKNIAIIVSGIVIIIFLIYIQNLKRDRDIIDHNYNTIKDSIEVISTKYDSVVWVKNSLILDKKDLIKELDLSKKEIKALEKKLQSTIAYYSSISGIIQHDTVTMHDTAWVEDKDINIISDYSDRWCDLSVYTIVNDTIATSTLERLKIDVPIQIGLTDDYKIFVKSDNPYFNCTNIESAIIDDSNIHKKERRLSSGLHAGIGMQYNILNKNIGVGPQVGIGINYRLF